MEMVKGTEFQQKSISTHKRFSFVPNPGLRIFIDILSLAQDERRRYHHFPKDSERSYCDGSTKIHKFLDISHNGN